MGWDLAAADVHGIADARAKLGDLIQNAAQGRPQVLRRHVTPVAVLLPATATGKPLPAAAAGAPAAATAPPAAEHAPAAAVPPGKPAPAAPAPASPGITDAAVEHRAAVSAEAPAGVPAAQSTPAPSTTRLPDTAAVAPGAAAAAPQTSRRLAPLGQAFDAVLAPATSATADGEPDAPAGPLGLPTGIASLDAVLGGLQPGRFYLVAAPPGAGGSLLATAAARSTALDQGLPVLYAASGLTRTDVAARIVAAHLPADYRRLRSGRLTPAEQADVTALQTELAAAPLYIDDGADLTHAAIAESVADLPGLALVVVDRLQSADDPRLPLSGPRLTDAVQALLHLARTRHLPVVAVVDATDPDLIASLGLDVTLTLTRDLDQAHVAVTERDLGHQATLILRADLAHARLTDPVAPARAIVDAPAELTVFGHAATAVAPGSPQAPGGPTYGSAVPAPATAPDAAPAGDRPRPAPEAASAADETTTPVLSAAPRRTAAAKSQPAAEGGYAGRDYSYFTDMIAASVDQALAEHGGDTEAATQALVRKAVPNGMAIFEATRVGANYEHSVYPEMMEFLRKKKRDGVDEIWEGRHRWENSDLVAALRSGALPPVDVDALDTNASFLSAFKTWLPIGALIHQPEGGFDPKRSGIYQLPARPAWHHTDLPDPIGNREEPGPILLDDATVRLLIRCAKLGLCDAPHITESWTSGASENLLEKFRRVLTEARETAIKADDTVTLEYVKAMYSKFVSTLGESSANLEIRRPDWMHIVRSQAFANLWHKARRAHEMGLTVVRLRGTDELHLTGGDWHTAFDEGRLTTQMKLKDHYTLPRTRKTT